MAQKDIQDIADYMKQLNESIAEEENACDEACREAEEHLQSEVEELEDEVIDKASLGFIDDNDQQDESDQFYSEDEVDTFEEDVSDCVEQEVAEAEDQATIEVSVFNEDGFGVHFAEEVAKNVPGVDAKVKKTLPNGDLLVAMSGSRPDLEKAYAFYLGNRSYASLSPEDKEDFEARLVFEDGDTLAEADYREAVAHCLDPIDVKASTANLVAKDTCSLSMVKEEKARRKATKILKALKENDFSDLPDEELDTVDAIQDAIQNHEEVAFADAERARVWDAILNGMGYTQEEWNNLTPEKREKIFNASQEPILSRTGFSDYLIGTDPKTGKKFRYRNQFQVTNPETGEVEMVAFNSDYDMDSSMRQHPGAAKAQMRKDIAAADNARKEQASREAMKKARGKDTWDVQDFGMMIASLDDKQRKQLMNELIADIEKDNGDDTRKAGEEAMFVKKLFGKRLTLRDFAKAWGKSAPGVMKFADETEGIWRKTLRDMGINSVAQFKNMPQPKFEQFLKLLKINLEGRKSGSIVAGR